jgi:hypothetical protein
VLGIGRTVGIDHRPRPEPVQRQRDRSRVGAVHLVAAEKGVVEPAMSANARELLSKPAAAGDQDGPASRRRSGGTLRRMIEALVPPPPAGPVENGMGERPRGGELGRDPPDRRPARRGARMSNAPGS